MSPQDASGVKAFKVMLKYLLAKMLNEEETSLSYSDLCTVLAMVANVVNERPVALWTLVDDAFVPLSVKQLLFGRTHEASFEHRDDLEEQWFRASKYQRDLLDMWWKQWKEKGFASLLLHGRLKKIMTHANIEVRDVCLLNQDNKVCGTYKLCRVLRNEISTSGQMRMVKVGYEEIEIDVGVQKLVLLVPTDEVELLRMSTEYSFELPGACCPGLHSDTAEQDDGAADMLPRRSLRFANKAKKVKVT